MARSLEEIIKDISALVNEFNELEEVEAPEGSIPIGVDFAIVFDVSVLPPDGEAATQTGWFCSTMSHTKLLGFSLRMTNFIDNEVFGEE